MIEHESVRTKFNKADKLMEASDKLRGFPLARLKVLQEAMRFYLFIAYEIAEVSHEADSCLYDLLADSQELSIKCEFGLVKLEGFACIDANSHDAESIVDSDLDYFEKGLSEAAKKIKKECETLLREDGMSWEEVNRLLP